MKTMIKKAINEYWYKKCNEEKSTKTTIRHLEIQKEPIGTPHVLLLLVLLPSMHRQL
jgi:hypothetical protein